MTILRNFILSPLFLMPLVASTLPATVLAQAELRPVLECVDDNGDGTYTAHFGYKNEDVVSIVIPTGSDNRFNPAPHDRGQMTEFLPGRHVRVFSLDFNGHNLVWTLRGPNGKNRTVTASSNPAQRCTPPEPTATATPEPTSTATPQPTSTVDPQPTSTATPEPTSSATPQPTSTATPEPTSSATPQPTSSATPEPSATATPEPSATATPETFFEIGDCPTEPQPGCKVTTKSRKAFIYVRTKDNQASNQVVWNWAKGEAVAQSELGNPLADTSFTLCAYDTSDSGTALAFDFKVAPGAGWETSRKGYKFRDREGANDGVQMMRINRGDDGAARVTLVARGAAMGLPRAQPRQEDMMVVQFWNSEGTCWTSEFTAPAAKRRATVFADYSE